MGEFRPSLAVVRRSTTTWFRDQLGNNKSIGVSSCSPVRLDAGRYRIYIESDVKLSATSPCVDDETKECSKDRYVKKIYEGGISIDADLPETDRVTDITSLVTAWSGSDPVPSYADQAELAPDRDPLITEEALDDNPNLYTFVDLLGPTFTHERCTNCHSFEALGGKIEIHIEEDRLSGFMDTYDYYERGRDMRPELAKWIDDELEKTGTIGCHLCHRPDETQLRQFSWLPAMLLGPAGPWDRMSALAICESMPMQNLISGGPEHFRRHVFDDPRIQWAIRVRWTPDEVIQPAPPVTWDEFVEKVDLWIDKGQMRCRPLTPEEERTVEPTPTPTTPPPDDTDRTPDDIGRTSSSADLESPTSNSCDDAKDLPVAELVEEPPPEFRVTEAQQVAIVNTLSVAQIGEADQVGQLLASGSSFTAIQPRWEGLITGLTNGNSQMDVYALVQWVLREYYVETNTDLQLFAAKVRAFNNQKDTIRGFIAENRDNRDEITEQLAAWEDELQQVCDDAQLANVDMQNAMQKQQQSLQMMSNISKMLHDTAMAVIGKIGG